MLYTMEDEKLLNETEKKGLSRKDFLKDTSKYAIGAAIGVAGFGLLRGSEAKAGTKGIKDVKYTWPFPYVTLNEDNVRLAAHTLYWGGMDCASGVFGGLCQELVANIGAPWTDMPVEVMLFGRGGGVGWGSLCGALNGGAAIISLVVDKANSAPLINELWGWYTTENLPTNAANAFTYTNLTYTGTLPQNISGSPLCHPSVSQWCLVANKKVADVERKERCARLAGDIAAKTVEILNAYFASTFVGTFTDPASNASCTSCHGSAANDNVMTHMECATCHGSDYSAIHSTKIEELGIIPLAYELENAYPNPFNSSTTIKFSIPQDERVRLEIYNIKGQLINSVIDSNDMKSGTYEATWDGTDNTGNKVADGIYLAKLTTGKFMKSIRLTISN